MNRKVFKHWNQEIIHSQIICTDFKSSKKILGYFRFFSDFSDFFEWTKSRKLFLHVHTFRKFEYGTSISWQPRLLDASTPPHGSRFARPSKVFGRWPVAFSLTDRPTSTGRREWVGACCIYQTDLRAVWRRASSFPFFFSFGHALDWGRPSGSLIDSVLPETTSAVDRRRTGSLDSLFNLPRATLSHRVYSRRLDRPQTAPGQGAPFWCVESFSFQYCPLAFGCQKKQHRELHLTATKDLKDGQKQNLEG